MAERKSSSILSNSFVDLMTSLAVIFILLLCATLNNAQVAGQTVRSAVLAEIRLGLKDYASGGIEVRPDPHDALGLLVLVPERLLAFELDSANISQTGSAFLAALIPRLSAVVCSPKYAQEINSIIVEGHTDSSGTDRHNWDLSQKRSMSVVRASLDILDNAGMGAQKAAFLRLLSASGRGSAELIKDARGAEDAATSRRVVFKLRFRSIEQAPLSAALKTVG